MFKVVLKSNRTDVVEVKKVEGNVFTTEIDSEEINSWIREFARDNRVTESSISYKIEEV